MKPDSLVFDLDGTLWDTCDACAVAWNIVLAREAIPFAEITGDDVRKVTGRSHEDCIRLTFAGLPEVQILKLVEETMTEDVVQIRLKGGTLYPGVAEGLRALSDSHRLFIVSNCQSGYIEMFLELSGLTALFQDFECWGNTGRPKSANLQSVIDRNHLASPIMVGDTPGDQQAAIACSVPFAFVEYGFQTCLGSDFCFKTFTELSQLFLQLAS
jgi:phosphoglycolate phosphatase